VEAPRGGVAAAVRAAERVLRDARGGGIAGLLGDLVASSEPVLAVAAHSAHRVRALGDRVGGFALTSWAALEGDPGVASGFVHVVAVDPPAHAHVRALAEHLPGHGWIHFAWGGTELELARRVLAWELDLRVQLADAYRALRAEAARAAGDSQTVAAVPAAAGASKPLAGERLAAILRGTGAQPRSGALAGRLLRVLRELGLIEVAGAPLAVAVPPPAGRTELERSPAFRAYMERLQDGLAYLSTSPRVAEPAAAVRAAA
jgi:single-stranded-DNA-specific exonuclease